MSPDSQVLDVILGEVRAGFAAITERLDHINGTVRQHGESIAVLERDVEAVERVDHDTKDTLSELRENFILHRARCPFDQGSRPDGATTANDQAVLDLAKRIRNQRLVVGASVGGGVVLVLIELVPRILEFWYP